MLQMSAEHRQEAGHAATPAARARSCGCLEEWPEVCHRLDGTAAEDSLEEGATASLGEEGLDRIDAECERLAASDAACERLTASGSEVVVYGLICPSSFASRHLCLRWID
eukprot:CAMPEP_0174727998 /NCGR_PEP_ID=MMETSP1094-20130205/50871_1 /TAXON_ID=156173 /ORGANISM="Chrysochromulina brevifilum, Strain UTEX LB 985" /LENGTH=109 /DNA_ID=CAMNT_0015929845 /DNA_START=167 /DNA_END=495 /DNA_ORIENTATION=-